ncbi:Hypothetical predicted protein [Paramuricea clavata]|uniref:Uncharacterized protein n=1 Tax=Paramuricea clavata TaxID=317549 RepID=A0A6S7GP66_PARCT|nr:Hypothetical predicted protein [Paramuricea clavata]
MIETIFFFVDLLDELYPENQLQPKDPIEKAKQKLFVEKQGETHLKGRTEETKQELLKNISKVEQYLAENKLQYFGGEFNNILL